MKVIKTNHLIIGQTPRALRRLKLVVDVRASWSTIRVVGQQGQQAQSGQWEMSWLVLLAVSNWLDSENNLVKLAT